MTPELALLSQVSFRGREISAPRLRTLLALLAADLGSGCSTRRLVDGIWPDERPEHPAKALQVVVSRARAQLGPDLIVSTSTGYRLGLGAEQVDAAAVQARAAAGTHLLASGDAAGALAQAEQGLALWSDGTPVSAGGAEAADADRPDPADPDPLTALRGQRAATRRTLRRCRALALSRLGRAAEAAESLSELVREHPRDEELLLELLRCEAATAGAPVALLRYDAYRRGLRDTLGTDPGPELQELHRGLLQLAVPAVRIGVPHEPNPLLGRDGDVAAVNALLRASRVVSVVGPGGLGKTRLAQRVGQQPEHRVVYLVPLAGIARDDEVLGEVASVLGVGETPGLGTAEAPGPGTAEARGLGGAAGRLLAQIVHSFGSVPALLILDNCEHVLQGAAELAGALVAMTADVRLLTTSRAPLGLSSETVYPLPQLSLDTTVELFRQRARAARPGAELPDEQVREVCRHLDGLPLAAELAAARVRVMSVPEIAAALQDRFALLRGGPRDAPERHRTLHAVVDWSWNLLDPAAQTAMRLLSVFPAGFTAAAAGRLVGGPALPVLEGLAEQSLLTVSDTRAGTRFQMLETVREFSAGRRESTGETDDAVRGFLAWAREFAVAEHEALFADHAFPAAARIRAEQDNLLAAMRLALAGSDGVTVAVVGAALGGLWVLESNHPMVGMMVQETAWLLSHLHPERPEEVDALRTVATVSGLYLLMMQSPHAARSLVTLRRLPPAPPTTIPRAVGTVVAAVTDPRVPPGPLLAQLAARPEPLLVVAAETAISYLHQAAGELDQALQAVGRALDAISGAARGGRATSWLLPATHARAAELCLQTVRSVEARDHLLAAVAIEDELGEWSYESGLRVGLVLASLQLGALDEAERWLDTLIADGTATRPGTVSLTLSVQGEIRLSRGDVDAGLQLWRLAVERLREAQVAFVGVEPGLDPWSLEVLSAAVAAHAQHHRSDRAAELTATLARAISDVLTPRPGSAAPPALDVPLCGTALLALALADLDQADGDQDPTRLRVAARMAALAERARVVRNFPTLSAAEPGRVGVDADGPAYAEAVSAYAGLSGPELLAAAAGLLREREALRPDRRLPPRAAAGSDRSHS